jgi:hypothetical protein
MTALRSHHRCRTGPSGAIPAQGSLLFRLAVSFELFSGREHKHLLAWWRSEISPLLNHLRYAGQLLIHPINDHSAVGSQCILVVRTTPIVKKMLPFTAIQAAGSALKQFNKGFQHLLPVVPQERVIEIKNRIQLFLQQSVGRGHTTVTQKLDHGFDIMSRVCRIAT